VPPGGWSDPETTGKGAGESVNTFQ
jgi:hypothetical protein